MLAMLIEEVHDRGGPCLLCGAPARNVGVWRPIRRLARYLGCPEGKDRLLVYALCDLCLDAPIGRVERALLDLRRAELAAGAAGLEIAGGLVHFSTAEDRRRFAAAYERWAPPAYYTLRGQ